MDFHNKLLMFSVLILSAQSLTSYADPESLTYKALQVKVANANMVPKDKVNTIINGRDLLSNKANYAKDCNDFLQQGFNTSGLYVIRPKTLFETPLIVVYCEMEYDCGGWTVLEQNSRQSKEIWNETWTTYEYGFGYILGDHYLGNRYMHYITSQMWYKARVVLDQVNEANQIIRRYAEYDMFRIGSELFGYKLDLGGEVPVFNNLVDNLPFSTWDRDSDRDSANCALKYGGGWWFDTCASVTPYAMVTQKESIHWEPFCKNCTRDQLLVRPVNLHCLK